MQSTNNNLRNLLNKKEEKKEPKKANNNQKAKMNIIDITTKDLQNLDLTKKEKKEEEKLNKELMERINKEHFQQDPKGEEPTFFEKPSYIDTSSYVKNSTKLYSNLYPIEINKNYTIYTYRIEFKAESENINTFLKKKIVSKSFEQLSPLYHTYFFSGDAFYSTKKIEEDKHFELDLFQTTHYFQIKPLKEFFTISKNTREMLTPENRYILKNIFELMFKDILKGNPDLKMEKNLFVKDLTTKLVSNRYNEQQLILKPGYSTKVVILENVIFLNVDNKNKIINSKDCFTIMKEKNKGAKPTTKEQFKYWENYFKGRLVETKHTNQKMKIDGISFDKNPKNTTLNYDGKKYFFNFLLKKIFHFKFFFIFYYLFFFNFLNKFLFFLFLDSSITMKNYYLKIYNINLNDTQPLLRLKSAGNRKQDTGSFYPSELCYIRGVTEEMNEDKILMKNISEFTKLKPDEKVNEIEGILESFNSNKQKTRNGVKLPSAKQRYEEYGLKLIKSTDRSYQGLHMVPPRLIIKDRKIITDANLSRPFKIFDPKSIKFICLYHPIYEDTKDDFSNLIMKCGAGYGITIENAKYIAVDSEYVEDWIDAINQYFTKDFNQVVCILDKYLEGQCHFYQPLKKHSLEVSGYPMQVVLQNTINKNNMAVTSNILLQINSKIGGSLFKVDVAKETKEKNLMICGIDISCTKKTNLLNIAMCATINPDYTKFTSKKESKQLGEENLNTCVSQEIANFIAEASLEFYKLNKCMPKGVIIYRQGVSKEQIFCLKQEVKHIEDLVTGKSENKNTKEMFKINPIEYSYILVNKKVNLKFFEKEKGFGQEKFFNPDSGLLILNDLVDQDIFEFYIQPQMVNSGCATPTCFQVVYGNLKFIDQLPKLTYDLCYMYSNWKGAVRVPAPLKYAEKLSKTVPNLCEKSKNNLYHL